MAFGQEGKGNCPGCLPSGQQLNLNIQLPKKPQEPEPHMLAVIQNPYPVGVEVGIIAIIGRRRP